jgi:hypothetical protein
MEVLEDRMVLSTLTVNGPANGMNPQVTYSGNSDTNFIITMGTSQIVFYDSAETITVDDPSGQFTGTGTHTVYGPVSLTVGGIFVFNSLQTEVQIEDSADSTVRTMTLKTATGDPTTGLISGLPSGPVNFKYGHVSGVDITTGRVAGNVVNVQATGGNPQGMEIIGTAAESVNVVGSAVGLAAISTPLYIVNISEHPTALTVDDSADTTARTAVLSAGSFGPPGGSINGLGGAEIDYDYASTNGVTIKTGTNALDVVNVRQTGPVPVTLVGDAAETVNVGAEADNVAYYSGNLAGIKAPLYIKNTEHSTALTVDDSADITARTAVLTTYVDPDFGSISGLGGAAIYYTYKDTTGVTINTGTNAKDVVNVQGTGPVPVTLVGHAALAVNVGFFGMALGVEGLTVENVGGLSTLTVDDSADFNKVNLTFSMLLTRSGAPHFGVLSSKNGNIVAYQDASTQSVTLKTGPSKDLVNVVNTAVPVNLVNRGYLNVVFSDGVGLSGGTITGGLGNYLDYHLYSTAIDVNLATGKATGTKGASHVKGVIAGPAGGFLTGANTTNLWQIKGANAGSVNGVDYAGIQNLRGGTGLDIFQFNSKAGTEQSIDGHGAPSGQGDWLDYSFFTTPVTVNLTNGSATNVNNGAMGAVHNIQNVISGSGTDTLTGNTIGYNQGNILIGHGGDDTITGGYGRSLLIGGAGPSTVKGFSGGDILIGGTTTYDAANHLSLMNIIALMDILAEWRSADSYTVRTNEISGGTIPGYVGIKLTVTDNPASSAEQLIGQASTTDLDWFFAKSQLQHLETVGGVTELVS